MNSFESFQPLMAIALTPKAAKTLQPLCTTCDIKIWTPELWDGIPNLQRYEGSLKDHVSTHWTQSRAIVFCMAMGATVRLIAPLLTHKDDDPAVVVVDANGHFVVSVCGGHRQGTDRLTQGLSTLLQSQAVITGASASAHWPGIDTLGSPFGWQRNQGDWTEVAALVAKGAVIDVQQSCGSQLWQAALPSDHPLAIHSSSASKLAQASVWIGCKQPTHKPGLSISWSPRVLWVGIGCERGTSQALIQQAILDVLAQYNLNPGAIAGVASLDLKADEAGIIEVCKTAQWPFFTFSAQQLSKVDVPNPSTVVQQAVQTPSVCEAAAITAAERYGSWGQGTAATLLAPKSIHKQTNEAGAVTVAIAQGEREWIGKTGSARINRLWPWQFRPNDTCGPNNAEPSGCGDWLHTLYRFSAIAPSPWTNHRALGDH